MENVRKSSKEHKTLWHKFSDVCRDHQRNLVSVYPCGYSHALRLVLRLALVPVIAGVSYELRSIDGSRLIENTELTGTQEGDDLYLSFRLRI